MTLTHDPNQLEKVLTQALTSLWGTEDTSIVFYDLAALKTRINELKTAFPDTAHHAIAVKANPLVGILSYLKTLDVGVEAATLPELYLAQQCGYSEKKLVFDSPAKTVEELTYALKAGIHLNIDNLIEISRVAQLYERIKSSSTCGIRINPQVGTGKIKITSVAGEYSKFGVPIKQFRSELIKVFEDHQWLRAVHLHVGSQGCGMEMLVEGVKTIYDFAQEVNRHSSGNSRKISILDIGGGLPVSYRDSDPEWSFEKYYNRLVKLCPQLSEYQLITEFGRFIHAHNGWVASRVEYVKKEKDIETIITHIGADMFTRMCYFPDDWTHRITVADRFGRIKTDTAKRRYTIAGPLCFSGDILGKGIFLPQVQEGDYLILLDTGAYTLGMWSRHNSRQIPKVIGYHGKIAGIIKEKETLEEIYKFWS
ncbi:diaminopimelate decarboxylase [candidate division KSB1 bacterium]|nr:diaminopimelate decarboxylase [candidate division KSB1 bacterium]